MQDSGAGSKGRSRQVSAVQQSLYPSDTHSSDGEGAGEDGCSLPRSTRDSEYAAQSLYQEAPAVGRGSEDAGAEADGGCLPRPPRRRWQRSVESVSARAPHLCAMAGSEPLGGALTGSSLTPGLGGRALGSSSGRALWLLGRRCVEMSLPGGAVRCLDLPFNVKSGSRGAADPRTPGSLFLLTNGSSRLRLVQVGEDVRMEELVAPEEASRFHASLGSRLVVCGAESSCLLVTGTPGTGAHTPWLFDLRARAWKRLPDAPHPILSSAVVPMGDVVAIVGGWSKQRSCHGLVQVLRLGPPAWWTVLDGAQVPWRRPGAGCLLQGQLLVALGWLECEGHVGMPGFRMLRRNGATQGVRTSSSRLLTLGHCGTGPVSELAVLPFTDSFEHNGEIYPMGNRVVCIGRDRMQAFDASRTGWETWRLPPQLGDDRSSSWTKHCGSWALAFLS